VIDIHLPAESGQALTSSGKGPHPAEGGIRIQLETRTTAMKSLGNGSGRTSARRVLRRRCDAVDRRGASGTLYIRTALTVIPYNKYVPPECLLD
jgi:hypothetical protein